MELIINKYTEGKIKIKFKCGTKCWKKLDIIDRTKNMQEMQQKYIFVFSFNTAKS